MRHTCLAIQSLGELVDCRGNLQTFVKDGALPLQADVARPFHKARQITLGLNVLAWGRSNTNTGFQTGTSNSSFLLLRLKCISDLGGKIVIIVVKIANIRLHHAHHKEMFSAKLKLGNLPMPKFFGLFSNRGFTTFLASCFLATEGAGATFFPLAFFPLGWKRRKLWSGITFKTYPYLISKTKVTTTTFHYTARCADSHPFHDSLESIVNPFINKAKIDQHFSSAKVNPHAGRWSVKRNV